MMDHFPTLRDSADRREDDRGWLQVLYESEAMVLKRSFSRAGVFRGLHAQVAPSLQVKLIRVVSGRIADFLVDLNDASRAIHRQNLGPERDWVKIADHYAHGFYAIEDTVFEYICDGRYDEANETAFNIVDHLTGLGIVNPLLSAKDRAAPGLPHE